MGLNIFFSQSRQELDIIGFSKSGNERMHTGDIRIAMINLTQFNGCFVKR